MNIHKKKCRMWVCALSRALFTMTRTFRRRRRLKSDVCHDREMLNGAICTRELLWRAPFNSFIYLFILCLFSQRWRFVDRIALFITRGQYFSLNKATAWITTWFKEQSQSRALPNAVAWICIADREARCITAYEQGGKMYLNVPTASFVT